MFIISSITKTIRKNLTEFKDFAFKGNLIQLAIAVVLGGAFGDLVKSFVANIFMPIISLPSYHDIANASQANPPIAAAVQTAAQLHLAGYLQWEIRGIKLGVFLGDFINFTVIALAIFLMMVKTVSWISKLTQKMHGESERISEPTEKECPFCLMKIPIKASKCGHCTADLGKPAAGAGATAVAGGMQALPG